jgi:hypothetical protein
MTNAFDTWIEQSIEQSTARLRAREREQQANEIDPSVVPEPDGRCRYKGCSGSYVVTRRGDCSCHIAPPCGACVDAPLVCSICGDDVHREDLQP